MKRRGAKFYITPPKHGHVKRFRSSPLLRARSQNRRRYLRQKSSRRRCSQHTVVFLSFSGWMIFQSIDCSVDWCRTWLDGEVCFSNCLSFRTDQSPRRWFRVQLLLPLFCIFDFMLLSVDYVFTNLVLVLIRNVIEFFAFFMMKLIEGERFSLGRPKMLCFAFD